MSRSVGGAGRSGNRVALAVLAGTGALVSTGLLGTLVVSTANASTGTGGTAAATPTSQTTVVVDKNGKTIDITRDGRSIMPSASSTASTSTTDSVTPTSPVPRSGTKPSSTAPHRATRTASSSTTAPRTTKHLTTGTTIQKDRAGRDVMCASYVVLNGVTLSDVSRATGVSVDKLADVNAIRDVDRIYRNSALCIPVR